VAELQCALAAAPGLEVKIARCFTFLGPYMSLDEHFAIGNFIRDQMNGGPIRVLGDGRGVRSYMYAGDLMRWLWTILLLGRSGRAYNVGSEAPVSIAEVAEAVAGALSPRVEVEIAGNRNRAGAAPHYVPSTARAREELGLNCRVGLREAIQRTQAWFAAEPHPA
jgi:dTDP-glucose 4,6-dehydratase